MLTYLDNRSSTRARPNENYGRELMELHTVGMIYTEADVAQAARLLTGLTVDRKTGAVPLRRRRARHRARSRCSASATPTPPAAGGEVAALALIDYLAMHPATAERIARKLCVRFVADEPPASLVSRLAAVYLRTRSAIAPVLRALFTSPEFAASVGAKVRTPFEDLAATLRVLGTRPGDRRCRGRQPDRHVRDERPGLDPPVRRTRPVPVGHRRTATRTSPPPGRPRRASWSAGTPTSTSPPAGIPSSSPGRRPCWPTCCRPLPATYGGLVDALARRLVGTTLRPGTPPRCCPFLGKLPTAPLKPGDTVARRQVRATWSPSSSTPPPSQVR